MTERRSPARGAAGLPLADLSGPTGVSLGAMDATAVPDCFNTPWGISFLP